MNAVLRLSSVPSSQTLGSLFINAQLIIHDETEGLVGKFAADGFRVAKIKVLEADENPPNLPTTLPEVDLNYHAYVPATRFATDGTNRIVVVPLKIRADTARSLVSVQANSYSELAVMVRPLFMVTRRNKADYKPLGEPTFHDADYVYKKESDDTDYQDVFTDTQLVQFDVFVKKTNTDTLGDILFPPQGNLNQNGVADAPAVSATHPVELNPTKE